MYYILFADTVEINHEVYIYIYISVKNKYCIIAKI